MRQGVGVPIVLAVLLALGGAAYARELPEQPLEVRVIRIEGHLGGRGRAAPAATLVLDADGARYDLQVDHADVLRGSVLASDFLAEVSPYRPSLRLHGAPTELDALRTAKPESTVAITGYQRSGSRDFFVSQVEVR